MLHCPVRLVTRPDLDGLTGAVLLSPCLLPPATADDRLAEIVSTLQRNG